MDKITVKSVYDALDAFAPFELQEDFDNSCLIAGRFLQEVKGILITVDVTHKVINEAVKLGCNLIVAHHPILFNPLNSVTDCEYVASVLLSAIENKINILAAHTNFDLAEGGINDRLAKLLEGKNIRFLDFDSLPRLFEIQPVKLYDYAKTVARILEDNTIRVIGKNSIIDKICVVGGSGGRENLIKYCAENDTVLLTADVKHNLAAMADDIDAKVIVFGHFTSEKIFVTIVKEILENLFTSLKIIGSKENDNPYRIRR